MSLKEKMYIKEEPGEINTEWLVLPRSVPGSTSPLTAKKGWLQELEAGAVSPIPTDSFQSLVPAITKGIPVSAQSRI